MKAIFARSLFVGILSGCSVGDGGNKAADTKPGIKVEQLTPVTIHIFQHQLLLSQEDFEQLFVAPVKKK